MEVPALLNRTTYLDTVRDQIRWKRARQPLTRELETHLEEQYADCLAAGMDEASAEAEAVRQMGDPVQVGQELDRIHRPKPQWKLLLLVSLLALFGAYLRVYTGTDLVRVGLYLVLGFCALFGAYLLDFTWFVRHAKWVYVGTILLSLLSMQFSPRISWALYYTRYLVLFYPLVYVLLLTSLRGRSWDGLLFALLGAAPLLVVILMIPNLSWLLIFLCISFLTLLIMIDSGWFDVPRFSAILLLCFLMLAICLFFGAAMQHALQMRLTAAFHPEQDPDGYGYIAMTIRGLLENASFLRQPTHTATEFLWLGDYLLTLLIAEFGWLPFLLFCAALLGLLLAAVLGCLRQCNQFGRLIALSIILTLGLQMLLSIPGNLGYPFLYTACPFVDGSFHTVLNMALVGVLLSVFRQEAMPHTPIRTTSPTQKFIRWEDGNLIISLSLK